MSDTYIYYSTSKSSLSIWFVVKIILILASFGLALLATGAIVWVWYECVRTFNEDPSGNFFMVVLMLILGLFPFFLFKGLISQFRSWASPLITLQGKISQLSSTEGFSAHDHVESGRSYYCFVEDQGYANILPNHYKELEEGQWVRIQMTRMKEVRKIELKK